MADNGEVAERAARPERITIRVHPGAARARVAAQVAAQVGEAGGDDYVLGVWVHERAVDGKATEAALSAVAEALGLRRGAVRLVTGERSRTKIAEIADPPPDLPARLARLLA